MLRIAAKVVLLVALVAAAYRLACIEPSEAERARREKERWRHS